MTNVRTPEDRYQKQTGRWILIQKLKCKQLLIRVFLIYCAFLMYFKFKDSGVYFTMVSCWTGYTNVQQILTEE